MEAGRTRTSFVNRETSGADSRKTGFRPFPRTENNGGNQYEINTRTAERILKAADTEGRIGINGARPDGKTTKKELEAYIKKLESDRGVPGNYVQDFNKQINTAQFILKHYDRMKELAGKSVTTDGKDAGLQQLDMKRIAKRDFDKRNISQLDLYPDFFKTDNDVVHCGTESAKTGFDPADETSW
jgi:hypothetical protein